MSNYANLSESEKISHRKASNAWSKKNRPRCAKFLRDWTRKRMIWFQSLKEGKACKYCGESNPVCLDYHHRDPKEKMGNLQAIAQDTADNNKVLTEISKCDLICANCHRKLHFLSPTT